MELIIVVLGVLLLLVLMLKCKLNAFISLILTAMVVGVAEMAAGGKTIDPIAVLASVKGGLGSTLGSMALIIGFGAMLGKLMADAGGAQRIALTLIHKLGAKKVQWAVMIAGFVVGIALFFEIGFVLMLPLVFTIAMATKTPLIKVGAPMVAALSVTHGFLPPHPGPTAIAEIYGADLGQTLLLGLCVAIPVVILAGPVFTKTINFTGNTPPEGLFNTKEFTEDEMPKFGISLATALSPVFLMALNAICEMTLPADSKILNVTGFIGDPSIALLIAVFLAIFVFGIARKKTMDEIGVTIVESVKSVAMIILIIGAGGAFKQVLVDSGVADYIVEITAGMPISPLILAWATAAFIRIALGSATVAAMTSAGIVAPLIATTGVSPELMVLASGAGSVFFSHVNDPGFWLFKEYFGLDLKQTFRSWSLLETIISVAGLGMVMLLSVFIG